MNFRQFAYRNVVRNRRIYAAFFMASVFSVMVFFLYSMLLFHPSFEDRFLQEFALIGMGVAEIILFIFTLFFLFYSMRAFLHVRSKEFGILLHLGMEKRQLHRLVFLETMLIGFASITVGIFIGYVFSKFFFMIVREILLLPALPLYLSWEPFALTMGAFLSLFIIISYVAPVFIRTEEVAELMQKDLGHQDLVGFSKTRGYLGLLFLALSYGMAASTSNSVVIALLFFLPPLATMGTYYFFTDSLPLILSEIKKRRKFYWRNFRLLSISEGTIRLRENARMFFIVTIVLTIALMSVGTLASLTSFASQYREVNPLGLVYKSEANNENESRHISMLMRELSQENIEFDVVKFRILRQHSSFTGSQVTILRLSELNKLADSFGYPAISLQASEALFMPYSSSSYERLSDRLVDTVLEESGVSVHIDGAYPHHLISSYSIGTNTIVVSDEDYEEVANSSVSLSNQPFAYYAFNIPEWQKTKDIGLSINESVTDSFLSGTNDDLAYSFDNPGLNYSVIRVTFSLLLFIGLLLAAVFLLAAGSFIYFRLYTTLERDKKQFEVLRRMGLTNKELKKVVNRLLIPQFFIPWGVAFVHSSFAFLTLQVIWDALAEISIVRELVIVLAGFTLMQLVYFYLIRWRYLAHIRAFG